MATSKKDYVAIAAIFAKQMELKAHPRSVLMSRIYAQEIANYFASENPKFDHARFLKACGILKGTLMRTHFTFVNHGSICLLTPHSQEAKDWADEHLPQERLTFGGGIAIEPRYAEDILVGIAEAGLTS